MMQKQIPPLTPEERKAWANKKLAQWERIEKALADTELTLGMVQTRDTFWIQVRGPNDFADEVCIGDPAKSVTRNDMLINFGAVDLSDAAIDAILSGWKLRRKAPPLNREKMALDGIDSRRE